MRRGGVNSPCGSSGAGIILSRGSKFKEQKEPRKSGIENDTWQTEFIWGYNKTK